jgi:hypothetical protein
MGGQSSIGFLQNFGQPNLPQLLIVATLSVNYTITHILGIIESSESVLYFGDDITFS